MSQASTSNQRIVLASRPKGAPTAENFRFEQVTLPELANGQVLLKTLFLSLDPYMRGRMSDAPSYAAPVAIDEVMTGGLSVAWCVRGTLNSTKATWSWEPRAGRATASAMAATSSPFRPGCPARRWPWVCWACRA